MIDKRTLELILTDQRTEIDGRASEQLCHRAEEQLVDLSSTQAQVIIGVRRSGKSTLCYQALRRKGIKFAYVDFDDERLAKLHSDQLNDVLEILYKIYGDFECLFLDEIQNVEDWHLFVNRMLRMKMHIVVTGSNAKLLSGELATHLLGRSKEIPLFPFSFREYCAMKLVDVITKTTKGEAFRRAAFDEFLLQGGFPELLINKDHKSYVKDLVDNILTRDIEQRYKIQYKAAFKSLSHHLLNVSPTIVSAPELARTFRFKSEHTVRNYIDYLKQAYLLISIQKFSLKSKVRQTSEKVYAVDVAMMNQRDNAFAGENLGHRLETVVLTHLTRKCIIEGLDVYYLNERSGECDFVVCKNNRAVQAIQVSYDITAGKTRKREIDGLILAAKQTGCKDLLLLTDHEYGSEEVGGNTIKIQPVYDWSLELGL